MSYQEIHRVTIGTRFTSSFLQQYTFYVGNKKEKFVFQTGNSAK